WRAFDMGQGFQTSDTLLDRRMAGENAVRLGLKLLNRIDKEHVSRAAVAGFKNGRIIGDDAERVCQAERVASQLDGGGVGKILALPADSQLDNLRKNWSDQGQQYRQYQEQNCEVNAFFSCLRLLGRRPPTPAYNLPENVA